MWFQTKIVYQRQFRAENMLAVHQDAALFILEQHNIPTRQILAYTEVIQINYTDLQLRLNYLLTSSTTWGYIKSRFF